jgi:hypothetical protein
VRLYCRQNQGLFAYPEDSVRNCMCFNHCGLHSKFILHVSCMSYHHLVHTCVLHVFCMHFAYILITTCVHAFCTHFCMCFSHYMPACMYLSCILYVFQSLLFAAWNFGVLEFWSCKSVLKLNKYLYLK